MTVGSVGQHLSRPQVMFALYIATRCCATAALCHVERLFNIIPAVMLAGITRWVKSRDQVT